LIKLQVDVLKSSSRNIFGLSWLLHFVVDLIGTHLEAVALSEHFAELTFGRGQRGVKLSRKVTGIKGIRTASIVAGRQSDVARRARRGRRLLGNFLRRVS
jgi:hypothetical protein